MPTELHLQAALNGVGMGLLTFDGALAVLITNDRLGAVLDIPPDVLRGCLTVFELLEASAVLAGPAVQQTLEACLSIVSGEGAACSVNLASGCGQRLFTMRLVDIGQGHWMAAFEEITARRIIETQALQRAMRDSLTGLCNRELFEKQASAAGEDAPRDLAVMLIDLDRFKSVNDTLGHPIGDALLRLVARRLLSLVRQDDLVARLGGDEFAILIAPSLDQEAMEALARRIVDVIGRPYLVEGHLVNIGASIGIAVSPRHGRDYDQLMRSADLALYSAKNAGCAGPRRWASSSCITSRRSTSRATPSSASRPCCAGATPSGGWRRRWISSPWRRRSA